jgi:hypothetical protein
MELLDRYLQAVRFWLPKAAAGRHYRVGLVVVNFLINAAGQTPNGEWHPYVIAVAPAMRLLRKRAHHARDPALLRMLF